MPVMIVSRKAASSTDVAHNTGQGGRKQFATCTIAASGSKTLQHSFLRVNLALFRRRAAFSVTTFNYE